MFGRNAKGRSARPSRSEAATRLEEQTPAAPTTLLAIVGQQSRVEGKFEVADSIEIECEIGGELTVGGRLVIGEQGAVTADVHTVDAHTVDAVIRGRYDGNMVATGNVEITATGRVSGNIETDSLVISQGGFFNGTVAKIREQDAHAGPRPVHLVEDKRLGAQK
jgi:cytoskeletal protein CcmA (bactofilin family)